MTTPARYVHAAEAIERTGFSMRTLRRKMDEGKFPPCVWLNSQTRAWPVEEFDAWMANPAGWGVKAA